MDNTFLASRSQIFAFKNEKQNYWNIKYWCMNHKLIIDIVMKSQGINVIYRTIY